MMAVVDNETKYPSLTYSSAVNNITLTMKSSISHLLVAAFAVQRAAAFSPLSEKSRRLACSSLALISTSSLPTVEETSAILVDESEARSVFGTKEYWDETYQGRGDFPADCYSWYFGWEVVGRVISQFIPDKSSRILLPGVGNDSMLIDLYKAGYQNILAQDYSEHAVARQQDLLSYDYIDDVQVVQGDVTNLPKSWHGEFDVVIEKGCLDAVYLSGERNVKLASQNLEQVLRPNGILISFSGVVPHDLRQDMLHEDKWKWLQDGNGELKAGCFVLKKKAEVL